MIVVSEDEYLLNFLQDICKDNLGLVSINIDTFELSNGLENEVLCISDKLYFSAKGEVKSKLNSTFAIFIFQEQSANSVIESNVVDIFDSSTNKKVLLNRLIYIEEKSKEHNILKSQLFSLNSELAEIMGGVESQLLRVKKTYESKAPKRLEEFKAFKIFSKYAAGEDMGGEFFDIFAKENKIFFMMSSTSSYILSSSILQHFSSLKSNEKINTQSELNYLSLIWDELCTLNKSKKKKVKLSIMTGILDINTLQITGHSIGHFKILSSNMKNNIELLNNFDQSMDNLEFNLQLNRGERILINSPGFLNSWNRLKPEFMVEELMINKKVKALDVLDELFFQIKKDSVNGFLHTDASSIFLEVQKNAMVQI